MWKVSESGDDSIFASMDYCFAWRGQIYVRVYVHLYTRQRIRRATSHT